MGHPIAIIEAAMHSTPSTCVTYLTVRVAINVHRGWTAGSHHASRSPPAVNISGSPSWHAGPAAARSTCLRPDDLRMVNRRLYASPGRQTAPAASVFTGRDLASWYGKNYADRVGRMFSPSTPVPSSDQTVTIPNGIPQVATRAQVTTEASNGKAGHNSMLQRQPGSPEVPGLTTTGGCGPRVWRFP
jgi:hypothetical protein